jgi:hypothetical protein
VRHVGPLMRRRVCRAGARSNGLDRGLYVLSTATPAYLTLRVWGCQRISSTVLQHGSFNVCLPARGRNIGLIGHSARPGGRGAGEGIEIDAFALRRLPRWAANRNSRLPDIGCAGR